MVTFNLKQNASSHKTKQKCKQQIIVKRKKCYTFLKVTMDSDANVILRLMHWVEIVMSDFANIALTLYSNFEIQ